MSKIFEKPDGVFRSEGKVIRVTQQAIDNAQSFYDILGDATEIGNEAFMNLDLSKWNSPKSPVIVTSYKRPIKRGSSFDASYYPSVKTQADIRIPQGIQKVGARAFKGVKGIEVLEVGNRTFNELGSSRSSGCTEFGEEAFANMEGLNMVCLGALPNEVSFGKNVFAGNGFINEFNHYDHVFGGFQNDLWGFSSMPDIKEKITSFNSSLKVGDISSELTGEERVEDNPQMTGLAELIDDGRCL